MTRPRPLDVVGEAAIETPAGTMRLAGRRRDLHLTLPSWRALLELARRFRDLPGRRPTVERFDRGLKAAGVTLELRLGPTRFARLGRDAKASLSARLLGAGPLDLRPARLAAALLRRRRPPAAGRA